MGDARLMRAIAAAAAAPLETWTVERMAHIAGMSRAAFAKRFHELTGDTPLHMLANIRMRMAAEALIRGSGPLEAAAAVAGYGSAAAFIRAFRKVYGLTPAQWRTGHRHASVYAQVGGDGGGGSALDDHT
jgi:AraC family transcriptional activator of mtrCDE